MLLALCTRNYHFVIYTLSQQLFQLFQHYYIFSFINLEKISLNRQVLQTKEKALFHVKQRFL